MNKIWFKRKMYGWGWQPASWQGWLVTIAFLVVIIVHSFRAETLFHEGRIVEYYAVLAVAVSLLIVVAYATGERPRWQWGEKKK